MTLKLDENQQKAVEHPEGAALVVAGPGSGKTTVIKERILNLIQKYDVDPWKILALAFNKDAADEIARRVLKELGRNYRGRPKFRTLHGFGKDIITSNYKKAGFKVRPETKQDRIQEIIDEEKKQIERETVDIPVYIYKIEDLTTKKCYIGQTADLDQRKEQHYNRSSNNELWQVGLKEGADKTLFEQIDKTSYLKADECEAYWIQHYRELPSGVFNQSDPVRRRHINQVMIEMFCKHFDIPSDALLKRKEDFKDLTDLFNKMQDEVKKAKLQLETGLFKPESIDNQAIRRFAQKYEEVKSTVNAIDFEDMLIYSANVLENSENLRQHYCNKYPYVLVDEFQDISPADFRLISQLSKNLFVVGDDDQAIYGFRGGDSEIMQTFYNRGDVSKYKVTRNYRSTATIVEHAKALIEYNKDSRISKDPSAENSRRFPIKVLETTPETAENILLMQFTEPVCQTQLVQKHFPIPKNILLPKLESKTAILTRTNAEVDEIKKMIEKLTPGVKKDIEVSNIHKVKGQEYDRVILIVNTLDVWETNKPYNSLPTDQNDENEEQRVFDVDEERRVFYVAMTRAKYELIVLGRNCQFIPEFQNVPLTKEELEEIFKAELVAREPKFKKELEEATKAALVALEFRLKKELEEATKAARRQHEPDINRLQRVVAEAENEKQNVQAQIIEKLPQQLKNLNNTLLEELIPVLNTFESQFSSLQTTIESNDLPTDLVPLAESFQRDHGQLLDLLKHHGLKTIEAPRGMIFNPVYHETVSPAIYSNEVPANSVLIENQRGYLLDDRVIRKAQVTVSKGRDIWTPERLDWIVERYIDRLMSEFQNKYQLNNINRALVKLSMVQYLMELDNGSVGEIDSFAVMDKRPSGHPELYANYCVGPEKTHLCTDVLRDFWNCMWQVVEQSRNNPESFDEPVQPPINKPAPMLEIEIPKEPLTVRNIEQASKTVKPIPRTNGSPLFPKAERIPLDKSISVIVPEPVEEVIDTPPISTDFTENLNTYVKDLKPETCQIVEVQSDPLYEPIDLIVPKPAKKVVYSRIPKPKNSLKIPNPQTQDLTPETPPIDIDPYLLETVNSNADSTLPGYEDILREQIQNLIPDTFEPDIVSYPPIGVNNNTQETPQEYEDILKTQIQDIKPETSESENTDNVTQMPTLETSVDGGSPVESTVLIHSDSSTEIDSDTRQMKGKDSSENKVENGKKSFGYYLREGGHFAVEKIKVIIFRKPSS